MNILVVRLGAMGDVIHALPAVGALKRIPGARVTWVIDPRWTPLLDANPDIDEIVPMDRRSWSSVRSCWTALRRQHFDIAIDFQGLVKSALVAFLSGADCAFGFDRSQAREGAAAVFYSSTIRAESAHVVDRNVELARAAGAPDGPISFAIPPGSPEGELPDRPFVLACPLAGWKSKQWPLEFYSAVSVQLIREGSVMVVNGPEAARAELEQVRGAVVHTSGISGLIDASRRAAAVLGVDSGPLHVAAALGKPGVAIFGPTDPARNGPYGGTIRVLRDSSARTTYKRGAEIDASMRAITPEIVTAVLSGLLRTEVLG